MTCGRPGRAGATMAMVVAALLAGPAAAQSDDDLAAAFAVVGIGADLADELSTESLTDAVGDTFRFAVPGSRPATVTDGFVDIVRAGATTVTWDEPPGVPCTVDQATVGPTDPIVICSGTKPDLSRPHALFWMQVAEAIPQRPQLQGNLAFPVLTDGGVPWEAQGQFAWDTFQGADRWHQVLVSSAGGPYYLLVQRWDGSVVAEEPTAGFAILRGDTFLFAVPIEELGRGGGGFTQTDAGPAPAAALPSWLWGTAVHYHDGSFGQSADDTSGVDSFPDTDTDSGRGPGDMAGPTSLPVTAGPAVEPEPSADESASPTPTSPATTGPTGGTTTTDDDGGSNLPLIVLGGLVVVVGGGLLFSRTRPPPVPPACDCTVTLALEGPEDIAHCCGGASQWARLGVEGADPNDPDNAAEDPSKLFLSGTDENGHEVAGVMVTPTITAECTEGATALVDRATYDWSFTTDDTGITVTLSVHVPVRCPNAREHPGVSVTQTHRIAFRSAPCIVGVIIKQTAFNDIAHVDIHIICGDYNVVFGYFPEGERSFGATIGGAPGKVHRSSGSHRGKHPLLGLVSPDVKDQIGEDYTQTGDHYSSDADVYWKVFWIEPDDCTVCTKLIDYWESLHANPGTYYLLTNNCATNVKDSLAQAGAMTFPIELFRTNTPSGLQSLLEDGVEKGKVTDTTDIRKP